MLFDLVELPFGYQAANVHVVAVGGADLEALDLVDEPLDEPAVDVLVDVEPFQRDAELAGVGEAAADEPVDGALDVGVVTDDAGVLAAEFKRAVGEVLAGLAGDEIGRASCRERVLRLV